jgi:hypothetical protein
MSPDTPTALDAAQRLALATVRPFEEAWEDLEARLGPPLREAFAEAAGAHRAAVEKAGLAGPSPTTAAACSTTFVRYVRGVANDVLRPLLAVLDAHVPPTVLHRTLSEAAKKAEDASRELPEGESMPWEDALAPDPADRLTRALGKRLARVLSSARKPEGQRDAPIRGIALHHLQERVLPGQSAAARMALQSWARWFAAQELTWSDWAVTVLGALLDEEAARGQEAQEDDDEASESQEEPRPERASWAAVVAMTRRLQAHLDDQSERDLHAEVRAEASRRLAEGQGPMRADLAVSGSFLFRPGPLPETLSPWKDLRPGIEGWRPWHARGLDRLRLHQALLHLILGASAIQNRLADQVRGSLQTSLVARPVDGSQAFHRLKEELDGEGPDPPGGLAARLEQRSAEAEALLRSFVAPPDEEDVLTPVLGFTESAVDGLHGLLRQVPDSLTLRPLPAAEDDLRRPRVDPHVIRLRETARQAFDALRMERIRTSPRVIAQAVETATAQLSELHDVVAFGFEAAGKELSEGEEGAEDRALTLAAGGLRRTAEALASLPSVMDRARADMADTVAGELSRGSAYVVDRALARRMQGQLLEARSRLRSNLRERLELAAPWMDRWLRILRAVWLRSRRRGLRLRRRIRSLLRTRDETHARTVRLRPPSLQAGAIEAVPLVYRRLFTFDPVSDANLLAGRDVELAEAEESWKRWWEGFGMPLIVTGPPGGGVSSFLGALASRLVARDASVVRASFDRRFGVEAELCAWIASLLGVEAPETVDELATRVLEADRGAVPDVCILDGLEHAYLRTPGGTDLVERLMTFMAETEPRVFWMASLTRSAWQLVQKSEPTASSQVEAVELAPLTVEGLRAAVLARHRRSGVPLHFQEPTRGRHILRRRLRRAHGEARHRLLETDYFERLHRSSMDNLRLAFFQWLKTADFGHKKGGLQVRPLQTLTFPYLESLDLTQNFTLKAFLEHRTLTLREHDTVFRIPRQESFQIFESLRNRHIIEPLPADGEDRGVSDILREELRYGISPLLTGAVATHLARRNIVH